MVAVTRLRSSRLFVGTASSSANPTEAALRSSPLGWGRLINLVLERSSVPTAAKAKIVAHETDVLDDVLAAGPGPAWHWCPASRFWLAGEVSITSGLGRVCAGNVSEAL